jgi:hypothetical protein
MTTPRENLINVLKHRQPEWIPIIGHIDSYNRPSDKGMPKEIIAAAKEHGWWSGHAAIAYSTLLGIDIAAWTEPPIKVHYKQCFFECKEEGNDTIKVLHTPLGDLREVVRTSEDRSTSYHVEHLIKEAKDLSKFASWCEDKTYTLDDEKSKAVSERANEIGQDGILISALSGTPLGMLIRVFAGPQTVAYLHADAPESLRDVFLVMEKNHAQEFSLCSGSAIDAVLGMDDTSTTTQSPAMFAAYCMDYTDRMAEIVHKHGKFYWHHSCGLIKDLLPLYKKTRMDAVHAFTEPHTGNVWINEGLQALGGTMAIIAGLQLMEKPLTNRSETSEGIKNIFKRALPGNNFILCLTPYQHLTMDEIHWLRDECRKYQKLTSRPV